MSVQYVAPNADLDVPPIVECQARVVVVHGTNEIWQIERWSTDSGMGGPLVGLLHERCSTRPTLIAAPAPLARQSHCNGMEW